MCDVRGLFRIDSGSLTHAGIESKNGVRLTPMGLRLEKTGRR